MFGETLSWWTPIRTTTNWPLIILGMPPLYLEMSVCRLLYHGISILILSKHVMHNVSRLCLRAHTLKVEAAAWLEDGSLVCDQCPGEDEHFNEVHALLFCQDHRVCELRKHFPFCLHLFLRIFQQPSPFYCNRSTTILFMISFLSRTLDFFFFFLSVWIYLWLAETSQQPISQTTWLKATPHCNNYNRCNH